MSELFGTFSTSLLYLTFSARLYCCVPPHRGLLDTLAWGHVEGFEVVFPHTHYLLCSTLIEINLVINCGGGTRQYIVAVQESGAFTVPVGPWPVFRLWSSGHRDLFLVASRLAFLNKREAVYIFRLNKCMDHIGSQKSTETWRLAMMQTVSQILL